MGKKTFVFISALLAIFICHTQVFANIDQLSNMSAEWIRTGNRNAATDATDIVLYNPAGIMKMDDGVHLNIANQILIRRPEHTFNFNITGVEESRRTKKQDSNDYLLPNIYGAYKKDPLAFFGGIYVPGSCATADFPNGSVNTKFIGAMTVLNSGGMLTSFDSDYLEATSIYLATEAGIAWKYNELVSVAFALRYITAENDVKAGASFYYNNTLVSDRKLDYTTYADGVGFIAGLNLVPMDNLNMGIRYESKVALEFETDLDRNDFPAAFGLADYKEKNQRDFPAMLGIGGEYTINPKLKTEIDFNWYFQQQADWGTTSDGQDLSDLAGDCWSLGGAVSYQLTEKLLVSAGTIYTQFDWNDRDAYYESIGAFETLYTDNWHVGGGIAYTVKSGVKLNLAIGQTIWDDETIEYVRAAANSLPAVQVSTDNATTTIAAGVDLAF